MTHPYPARHPIIFPWLAPLRGAGAPWLLSGVLWIQMACCALAAEEFIQGEPFDTSGTVQPTEQSLNEMLHEALSLALDENYPAAIPLLERVITRDPTRLTAWESLGWAYWHVGQPERTRRLWERLRLLDPGQPQVYNWLASYYLRDNDLPASIEHYERSLALDPRQDDIRFYLARVYRWRGYLSKAIEWLESLWAEFPDRDDIRLELARALTSNWNYAEALPHWLALRANDPDDLEYLVAEAGARLHTGQKEKALERALKVLDRDPDNLLALQVLADAGEYGPHPEEGVPWLYRMLEVAEDEAYRQLIRMRLSALLENLHRAQPKAFPLVSAIALQTDRITSDPNNVDAHLKRSELLLSHGEIRIAQRGFQTVLHTFNPKNLRALRGLHETHMALRQWPQAERTLRAVARINPKDPYLHYDAAVLYANRGNYSAAYAELDRLEAAGRRGAVAVLLYHSLGTSPYGQAPSREEFREQLLALRQAGYTFMTPSEMKAYFESLDRSGPLPADEPPPRLAVITFDDALTTAMEHGTPVGKELGIVFAQHIIVRNTHRGDAYLASWDELRDYQETGVWVYGSHSYYAHQEMPLTGDAIREDTLPGAYPGPAQLVPVDEVARRAYPLGNRIWRPDADRLETKEEFVDRLREEYGRSLRDIEELLDTPANFFAYPFGEIGQQAASNEPEAIELNKQIGAKYYDMGFLQSYFGHAVNGDDPMTYQRHEMALRATGEETVRYFLQRHPVYLAQRTRLELALQEGNLPLARQVHAAMQKTDYPYHPSDPPFTAPDAHLRVSKMPRPWRVEWEGDPFEWERSRPFVRMEYEQVEDHLDNRSTLFSGHAGINLAPNVLAEIQAGKGLYKQSMDPGDDTDEDQTLNVDEQIAGVRATALYPNGVTLSGELGARIWSGDANDTILRLSLQAQGFNAMHGEWLARYAYDAVPAARAMTESLTHHTLDTRYIWYVADRVDSWFDMRYHDISDGNTRYHLECAPAWQVRRGGAWRFGARYAYASSEQESQTYWTPYRTHALYAEAGFRKGLPGLYFSLDARIGLAREAVRPETRRAFRELETRAEALGFDPGPPPEQRGWDPVLGISASLSYEWTPQWAIIGYVSYFESVDYDQTDIRSSLEYRF